MGGSTPLLQTLKELEKNGIPGEILTTNYLNFSEPKALEKLHGLSNITLKMYDVEKAAEGFHTKGYAVAVKVEDIINRLKVENISDIIILTYKTEEKSALAEYIHNGKYNGIKFTTCRKFKGLEADAVILVDVDGNVFGEEHKLLYYVGTSRARLVLDIVTDMDDFECENVLQSVIKYNKKIKKPKRELAMALNAVPII